MTSPTAVHGGGRIESAMGAVAARIGITTAQAYTVATGVVLAIALGAVGLPPVLRGVVDHPLAHEVAQIGPAEEEASAAVATTAPPPPTADVVLPPSGTPQAPSPPPPPAAPPPVVPAAPPTTEPDPEPHTVSLFADFDHEGTPGAIAAGADGTVYVTSDDGAAGGSWIVALGPEGDVVDSWQIDGQSPKRSRGLSGIVVDGNTVVVVDASRSRLLFLDPATGHIDLGPAIPDVPACLLGVVPAPCEQGLLSYPPQLSGVDVAPGGGYYVSDRTQGIVWKVNGDDVRIFTSFEDRFPGEGPTGVSVDRYGDLIVPVSARLVTLPLGAPAVYVVRVINANASRPRLQLEFGDGQVPSDLVVGESGRTYLTLPSRNQVLDIGLDSNDRLTVPPGDTPFDQPDAVALTDGELLVADRGRSQGRWTIHAISVLDRPAEKDL